MKIVLYSFLDSLSAHNFAMAFEIVATSLHAQFSPISADQKVFHSNQKNTQNVIVFFLPNGQQNKSGLAA